MDCGEETLNMNGSIFRLIESRQRLAGNENMERVESGVGRFLGRHHRYKGSSRRVEGHGLFANLERNAASEKRDG